MPSSESIVGWVEPAKPNVYRVYSFRDYIPLAQDVVELICSTLRGNDRMRPTSVRGKRWASLHSAQPTVLELVKEGMVRVSQDEPYQPIYVRLALV